MLAPKPTALVRHASTAEFVRSGHVLLLSATAYVLLSGAHTHMLALIMLDVTQSIDGMSFSRFSLAIGLGNLIKSGVLIFAGLTAYDTWRIKREYYAYADQGVLLQKAGVMGAVSLYLDFINLFLFILRILGGRGE